VYGLRLPVVISLLASLILLAGFTLSTADSNTQFHIVIYGDPTCPHCRATYNYLSSIYDGNVVFCDIVSNETCYKCYSNIIMDFYSGFGAVPVTLFVVNGSITGVVLGEISGSTISNQSVLQPLLTPSNSTTVFGYEVGGNGLVKVSNVTGSQESLFEEYDVFYYTNTSSTSNVSYLNYIGLIPSLILLSLVDSLNPCELVTFFSLATSALGGRKRSYGPPLLFIAIVYIGYLTIGLGLYQFARLINPLPLAFIALAIGVYYTVRPGGESTLDTLKCRWCERLGLKSITTASYLTAAVLAIISVTVLLPCTAGPYLIFATILRSTPPAIALLLLVAYNTIFILPLLILLLALRNLARQKKVAIWLSKNASLVNFLIGLVLVLISIYVITLLV
jgi:glutaredoxin